MDTLNWMGSIFTPRRSVATADSPLVRMTDTLLVWLERTRQRAALARLDDRLLADIGCDRATAMLEADKPCWKE